MRTMNPSSRRRPAGRSCLKKQRLNKVKAHSVNRVQDREATMIRFATRKKLKRIPMLNTFTSEEIEATWYSRNEVDTITHEADTLVLKAEESPEGTSVLDFDGESIRGLERKTQDGHHEAFLARVRVYQAVLDEQDAQRSISNKLQDGNRIAELSQAASGSSRQAALERARRDEADIQVYLHCSRNGTQSSSNAKKNSKCDPNEEPELGLEDVFRQPAAASTTKRNPSVAAFIGKRNSTNSLKGGKSDASWITRGTGCTSTTSFESLDMSVGEEDMYKDDSFRSQTSTGSSSSSGSGGKDKLAAFANKALQAAAASNRRRSSTFQRATSKPSANTAFGRKNTYTGSIRAEAAKATNEQPTASTLGRKNTYTGSIRAEPTTEPPSTPVDPDAKPAADNAAWTATPNKRTPTTKTYITTSNKKTPPRAKPAWMTANSNSPPKTPPPAFAADTAAPATSSTPRMRRDSCYARTGGMSAMAAAAAAVQQADSSDSEPATPQKPQLRSVKSSPAIAKAAAPKTNATKMRRDSCYARTGGVSSMAAAAALAAASLDADDDAAPPLSSMSAIAALVKADLDGDSIGKNSSDEEEQEPEPKPEPKPSLQKVKSVPALTTPTKKVVVGRQRRDSSCMARSSSVASMPAARARAATPERRRTATPERRRTATPERPRAATPEPQQAKVSPKSPVSPRTAKRNGYRRGSSFKRAQELQAKAEVIPSPAQTAMEAPEILVPTATLVRVASRKSLSGSSRGTGSTRRGVVSVSSRKSLSAMDDSSKKAVVAPQRRATAPPAPASPKRTAQAVSKAVVVAAPASPVSPKKPTVSKAAVAAPASPATSTGSSKSRSSSRGSSKSRSSSKSSPKKVRSSSAARRRQRPSVFAIAPPSLEVEETTPKREEAAAAPVRTTAPARSRRASLNASTAVESSTAVTAAPTPAPAVVAVTAKPASSPPPPSRKSLSSVVAASKRATAPRKRPATPTKAEEAVVPAQTNVAVEPEATPAKVQPSKRMSTISTTPLAELQKRTSTPPPITTPKKSTPPKKAAKVDDKPPVPTEIEVVTAPEVNADCFDDFFGILTDPNFDANLEMTFSQKNLNAQLVDDDNDVSEITEPSPGPQEMKRKSLQTSRIRRDTLDKARNLQLSGIADPDAKPLRTSRIRRDTLCARNLDFSGIVDPDEKPANPIEVKPLRTSRIRRDTLCARNLDVSGIVDPDAGETTQRPSRAVEKSAPSLPQTSHNSMQAVTSPPTITKMLSPSKKKPSLSRTSETASRLSQVAKDPSLALEASKEIQVPARPNLGRRSSSKKSKKPMVTSVTPTIHNDPESEKKKKFPTQKQRSKKKISLDCAAFGFDQPAANTTTSNFRPPRTTSVEV